MNHAKRTGTAFERAVVEFLAAHGSPTAERRALSGARDRGDVAGLPGWVLECKALKALDVAGAVDEARVEAGNASARWFAAVLKRRRKPIGRAYVVLELETFAALLTALRQQNDTAASTDVDRPC